MKRNIKTICPICRLPGQNDTVEKPDIKKKLITYNCERCGKFKISTAVQSPIRNREVATKLSGWIRNLSELGMETPEINVQSLKEIEQSIPEYNPSDKQYLFLRNISRKSKYPGDSICIVPEVDYPLAWASAPDEILFYIRFLVERGLLFWTDNKNVSASPRPELISVAVTPYGWKYLDEYEERAVELSQAFVSMSFSKNMKPIWEDAIKPAINEAGYKACRIESKEYTNKINARIMTEIRNSLFVIADVTEHKNVVYFEAGYAIGRNLPVIWCVHKDNLVNVHFDPKQYNHVVWKTTIELKEKLYDVICAVVGRRKKI